jgi:hypothetical protein
LPSSPRADPDLERDAVAALTYVSVIYPDNVPTRYAKHNYENTAGGVRIATSVGGALIGLGGDILIGDDLNSTEDVESEAERETVKGILARVSLYPTQ